jgi:hypothetical protein
MLAYQKDYFGGKAMRKHFSSFSLHFLSIVRAEMIAIV